jgi:multidrug efflux pump subunit AcrB
VQLGLGGISPEDGERLLFGPVETRLKAVTNIKEMRSQAYEGGGHVLLEFNAGFDSTAAIADVRAKVDDADPDLIARETTIGAPSTQWWIHLSSAMVFGLAFATVPTLVVTPSASMVFTRTRRTPSADPAPPPAPALDRPAG